MLRIIASPRHIEPHKLAQNRNVPHVQGEDYGYRTFLVEQSPRYQQIYIRVGSIYKAKYTEDTTDGTVVNQYGYRYRTFTLPMPWTYVRGYVHFRAGRTSVQPRAVLFTPSRAVDSQTRLYSLPLPNSDEHGGTCGGGRHENVQLNKPQVMARLIVDSYWSSGFNSLEYVYQGHNRLYKVSNAGPVEAHTCKPAAYKYWETQYNLNTIKTALFLLPTNMTLASLSGGNMKWTFNSRQFPEWIDS